MSERRVTEDDENEKPSKTSHWWIKESAGADKYKLIDFDYANDTYKR